jgi:hypothetical protein
MGDLFSPPREPYEGGPAYVRKRAAQPEHALQVQVHKFTRDCIDAPHVFLAFDRTRKLSAMQHVREKSRGLRAGTADTLLLLKSFIPIWVELKAGDNKPSDLQYQFGQDVTAVGNYWGWTASVDGYRKILAHCGVPLRPSAPLVSEHLDRLLLGAKLKHGGKVAGNYRKPRTTPPSGAARRFGRAHEDLGRQKT